MHEIGVELVSAIGLFGRNDTILLEGRRRSEFFLWAAREIQVEPVEGMVDGIPECPTFQSLRAYPEVLLPERIGAGQQSIFQHIDGRAELLPQNGAERCLH